MTKNKLMLLAIITIVGFSVLSFIIHYFIDDRSFFVLFDSKFNVFTQIAIGCLIGLIAGWLGWMLTQSKLLKPEVSKYTQLFKGASLNFMSITIVSLCAGIGEELFFRGIMQQYLGVVITAIIFVAIHGYLNPKNWRISIYGGYMTIAIMIIGVFSEKMGLITAISAHAMIDFVLLYKTKQELEKEVQLDVF